MIEMSQSSEPEAVPGSTKDKASLFDYAVVMWRYSWLIFGIFLVSVVTTYITTKKQPKIYESTATLLVSKEGGSAGILGGLAAAGLLQQIPGAGIASLTPNRDMLLSILKSRTVAQRVAEEFRFQERFRTRHLEDAIAQVRGVTRISLTREGLINVTVEDTDSQRAARIANFYVDELNPILSQFSTGQGKFRSEFVAEQLARAKRNLVEKEEALRRYQERNRAPLLPQQTTIAMDAAARIKGQIMALEVQLEVMRSYATEANPEMISLRRQIEKMKRQLAEIGYGDNVSRNQSRPQSPDQREFSLPIAKVPEMGLDYARLSRDLKIDETLVTLLTQMLDQTRISVEAGDLPIVQVLDRAVPTVYHSKPRLRSSLLRSGVTSLAVGVLLAFFIDYVRKLLCNRPRHA